VTAVVLGLDLSLTGAGMAAVPVDWNGDWTRIAHATVGHPLRRDASEADRVGRHHALAEAGGCALVVPQEAA
jgi:hypothetical protein